jgi:MoxR-like ATPase
MFITQFKQALPFLFEANVAVMVQGHHGIGKSQAVAQFAKENGYNFIDLRLGTQDVGDLLGLADFERDAKGNLVATKFFRPDWFPHEPNSKGIIFMDEINRARRDVLQAVFQLVLDKRLHRYELPKQWFVIAAMNPNTDDYIVTDISDKAFMDRFCHIKLAPSKDEWFDYAESIGVKSELMQFLKEQPDMMQAKLEDFSLQDVKPSRRSWMAVDRLSKTDIPMGLFQETIRGLVGPEAASAYIASLKNADKPLTAKEILSSFDKVKSRLEKYCDYKTGGRVDLLKHTCDELKQDLEGRKKPLTANEGENLISFMLLLPKDLSFSFSRAIYLIEHARTVMDGSETLKKGLASVRNYKLKDTK